MRKLFGLCISVAAVVSSAGAAPLGSAVPAKLQGSWRITRILPTTNVTCWDTTRAHQLIGTVLVYRAHSMRWKGGEVPLQEAFTRQVGAQEFVQENGGAPSFEQLGIQASALTEVDLQHEDADITGATTEVPGDSVLLAGPNRIVVSACHVFYEATRASAAS